MRCDIIKNTSNLKTTQNEDLIARKLNFNKQLFQNGNKQYTTTQMDIHDQKRTNNFTIGVDWLIRIKESKDRANDFN